MSLELELLPARAFFRRRRSQAIRSLPGFVRGRHRIPGPGPAGEAFVHSLCAEAIAAEVRAVYDGAKQRLGLRRRQLERAVAEGGGNVDSPQFRFALEVALDPDDRERVAWLRRVNLLVSPQRLPEGFDGLFPAPCDELVVPFSGLAPGPEGFDRLVERLEDFADDRGAELEEDESLARAVLTTGDGSRLEFDLGRAQISLRVLGYEGCRALLLESSRRFADVAGPVVAALEDGEP